MSRPSTSFLRSDRKTWMPGTSPGMTSKVLWCPTSPAIDASADPLLLSANSKTRPGRKIMTKASSIRSVETLSCDAGWRNYHFVKVMTEDGIVGWSEFDEGFGAPGVGTAIQRLSTRIIGQNAFQHERIYAELFSATRPAPGGLVALAVGAIENPLLDVKAKALGVTCYELLR